MSRRTIGYCTIRGIKQLLSNRPNELNKSKLSLGVTEQVARKRREQKRYKDEVRNKTRPASGAGRGHGRPPDRRVSGGVSRRGPPTILTQSSSLIFVLGWVVAPGSGGALVWATRWLAREGGCRDPHHVPAGDPPIRWSPMTTETKNRNMGPRGLPPQAPLAGVGADFKTVSWGGSNDGRAGAVLARPEGPMGPRIAAYAVSNATMLLSTTNANDAIFFATVLKQLKQREVM
jgi:hypothetical protein